MELRILDYRVRDCRGGYRCEGIRGTTAEGRRFSLWVRSGETWRLSWSGPDGRSRKHFPASDLADAVAEADRVLNPCSSARSNSHRITDVFSAWSATLTCSDDTKERDYGQRVRLFCEWCVMEGLLYWHELRLEHIQRYLRSIDHLSPESTKKRFNPIRRAAKWAAWNWRGQYHDFTEGIRLSAKGRKGPQEFWSFAEVFRFMMWVRSRPHGWNLLPGIALTGFCSLRVSEALRLTWEDWDGENLFIAGKKTDLSERLIPAPKIVKIVLSETPRGGGRDSGRILGSHKTIWSYGQAFRRYLEKRAGGRVRRAIEPKGLRRTLVTEAMRGGWYGDFVQLYRGHQPETISRVDVEHYAVMEGDWLLEQMTEQVVKRIDAATENLVASWMRKSEGKVVRLR